MTLAIIITHNHPGYPKDAMVTPIHPTTGEPAGTPVRVTDGGSVSLSVHSGVQLVVTEVDPEGSGDAGPPPTDPV